MNTDTQLTDWRDKALQFEQQINQTVIGLQPAVRISFWRICQRHVLLEGNVGVGKTTLLKRLLQSLAAITKGLKALLT
jgi:MoxR-like ATPase